MKNFLMFPLNLSKPARIKLKGNSDRQAQPWQAPEEFCNTTPTLITVNCNLKLMFFEKATKLEKIFHIFLTIVVVVQASKNMGNFILWRFQNT